MHPGPFPSLTRHEGTVWSFLGDNQPLPKTHSLAPVRQRHLPRQRGDDSERRREHGDTAIDVVEDVFKLWQSVSNRDLTGVLAAFASGQRNVEKIIEAIRAEFGID